MLKAIFFTSFNDVKNFFEGYFVKSTVVIAENFLLKAEQWQKKLSQQSISSCLKWLGLGLLFTIYGLVWLFWIFLPIIISVLLYFHAF